MASISYMNSFVTWLHIWRVLYLDGVHFSIRHGDQTDSTSILTALGVDLAGNTEVLDLRACEQESKDGWAWRLARPAFTRSHPGRSDREGWA
jgi:mutator family transposase